MRYVGVVALTASALLSATGVNASTAMGKNASLCRRPDAADRLCREFGTVTVVTPSSGKAEKPVSKHGRRVERGSKVRVEANGSAQGSFGFQAQCSFGRGALTELFTRVGGPSPETQQDPLFWQESGRSLCTFANQDAALPLFCNGTTCPAVVYSDGYSQRRTDIHSPVKRARAAQSDAGGTTTTQQIDVEFCAGEFRIDVDDDGGKHQVAETVDNDAGTPAHVRVTLIETVTTTGSTDGSGSGIGTGGTGEAGGTSSSTSTVVVTGGSSDGSTTTVSSGESSSSTTVVTSSGGGTTSTSTSTSTTSSSTTSSSNSSSRSMSIALKVVTVSRAGVCNDPVFAAQRRWAGRG